MFHDSGICCIEVFSYHPWVPCATKQTGKDMSLCHWDNCSWWLRENKDNSVTKPRTVYRTWRIPYSTCPQDLKQQNLIIVLHWHHKQQQKYLSVHLGWRFESQYQATHSKQHRMCGREKEINVNTLLICFRNENTKILNHILFFVVSYKLHISNNFLILDSSIPFYNI